MIEKKSTNQGFCRNISLSRKLRNDGRSSEAFEIMLSALTLEELIALKLESASRLTNGKLYGFNLWSNMVNVAKEALYNAVISVTNTNREACRVLGITEKTFSVLKKKYNIKKPS